MRKLALALLMAACAHQADGPDLDKLRADPKAMDRAKQAASDRCGPGPPPDACCVALMEQGDVLWATGERAAAGHAYEHARNRCPRFAPIRRHAFLMKQSALPRPAPAPAVDVRMQVQMDVRLQSLRLAWYEAYLDGQPVIDQLVHTTVGAHEALVELYLEPLVRGEAPVRLDVTEAIDVPAELAGRTAAGGGLALTLRERPAGTITERVMIETVPRAFTTEEKFLDELRAGRLLAPRSTPDGGPADPRASHHLLTPDLGHGQLLTPIRQLLPEDLKRRSFVGVFKVCVTPAGEVESALALKSPGPENEGDLIAAIRRWKYRPYRINGAPVAFCYPVRLAGERD